MFGEAQGSHQNSDDEGDGERKDHHLKGDENPSEKVTLVLQHHIELEEIVQVLTRFDFSLTLQKTAETDTAGTLEKPCSGTF